MFISSSRSTHDGPTTFTYKHKHSSSRPYPSFVFFFRHHRRKKVETQNNEICEWRECVRRMRRIGISFFSIRIPLTPFYIYTHTNTSSLYSFCLNENNKKKIREKLQELNFHDKRKRNKQKK